GENDARVREAARKAGYEVAYGLPGDSSWRDPHNLPRAGVWRKDHLLRFAAKTSTPARARRRALAGEGSTGVSRTAKYHGHRSHAGRLRGARPLIFPPANADLSRVWPFSSSPKRRSSAPAGSRLPAADVQWEQWTAIP